MTQFIKSNMETKLNIIEILKDKPKNTKLYSPLFGNVYLAYIDIDNDTIEVRHHGRIAKFYGRGTFYGYPESELLLFPSKEMRDWEKFAWKKGDILVSNDSTTKVIFNGWKDDTYTLFRGAYAVITHNDGKVEFGSDSLIFETCNYKGIEVEEDAQFYINYIERKLGGKLNLDTLEIEKSQPEFKKGDIAFADYGFKQAVFIVSDKTNLLEGYNSFIALDLSGLTLDMGNRMSFFKKDISKLRLATEEEKQQLFNVLAENSKAWDAEKKQIVNLKPKADKLKPFDKVLIRDCSGEIWRPSFFARYLTYGRDPYQVIGGERVKLCIPYEGNESLLGTAKDVEG